jgi:hypothetical protein
MPLPEQTTNRILAENRSRNFGIPPSMQRTIIPAKGRTRLRPPTVPRLLSVDSRLR